MRRRSRFLGLLLSAVIILSGGCFLAPPPHSDYRDIHRYSLACDTPMVQAILQTNSAAVNLPDDSHRTPLHAAASRNCTNVIPVLLHAGAKLEPRVLFCSFRLSKSKPSNLCALSRSLEP